MFKVGFNREDAFPCCVCLKRRREYEADINTSVISRGVVEYTHECTEEIPIISPNKLREGGADILEVHNKNHII